MSEEYWLEKAERILEFLRHSNQIAAVDADLWFFKGAASDQLAAFLQREHRDQVLAIRLSNSQD